MGWEESKDVNKDNLRKKRRRVKEIGSVTGRYHQFFQS